MCVTILNSWGKCITVGQLSPLNFNGTFTLFSDAKILLKLSGGNRSNPVHFLPRHYWIEDLINVL